MFSVYCFNTPGHRERCGGFSGSAMPPTPRRSIRRSAVCPSNMARITAKLCENAFQTIPVKSIFGRKKKKIGEIFRSRKLFYAFLAHFWRIYGETDLNGEFLAIFRSRCTYYELCTTKNRPKYMRGRLGACNAPTLAPPPNSTPPFDLP